MTRKSGVFLLLLLYCCIVTLEASLKVKIDSGWVKGAKIGSMNTWRGIPFAKPPIGQLRFEPPKAPDNWKDVWDATYDRSQCMSIDANQLVKSVVAPMGSEDCLYINVYVPNTIKKNVSLPVMVWIYGGAFIQGNSSYTTFGPDPLVKQNVIVVSFNYRLGIFGFLSTGDDAAPGNNGLRDQIAALHWVQRNIKAFGGDPKKVTIFGESAGSASVSYLILSPLAEGLFSGAIMESGSSLCAWALSKTAKEGAFATGSSLGIITLNSHTLVRRLKMVPDKELQRAATVTMGAIMTRDPLNGYVYAPVIEAPGPNAVLTGLIYENLNSGTFAKVPQIIGYNSDEALIVKKAADIFSMYVASYDFTPPRLVPISMKANPLQLPIIGTRIKTFYAGPLSMAFPDRHFLNYASDTAFVRPIQKMARLTAKNAKTYVYKFSYVHDPRAPGAAHTDELNYLFKSDFNDNGDEIVRNCITKLWANFARYRNPTPSCQKACGGVKWAPISPNGDLDYIDINENTVTGKNPDKKNMDFWEQLFAKYSRPPLVTY